MVGKGNVLKVGHQIYFDMRHAKLLRWLASQANVLKIMVAYLEAVPPDRRARNAAHSMPGGL